MIFLQKNIKPAKKVIINTIVLYAKIIITMAMSLITVPIVLHNLGQSDYGLYSLVAGIVAMLAFLNNSMSVSTQRFISVAMGEGNLEKINSVYNINIQLHLLLGILVVIALEILGLFIFEKLNIDPENIFRAKILFQFLIVTTFAHIVQVPLNGVINAREDMIVFSLIGLIDSLLSLCVAASLSFISCDKLIYYGAAMMTLPLLSLLLTYLFVKKAYPEYYINLKKYRNRGLFIDVFKFSGWNLFGATAMMARNQGVAIIINLFLGTIANAAYGIANQINGACSQFTSTLQKALNPQLMKSEGMGDRDRLHRISFYSSKYGVLALGIIAIPLIIEMSDVLHIWLRSEIPPYTVRLSQFILLLSLATQYSSGLMSSIQATGDIRNYQIIMSCIIIINLPVAYIILYNNYPVYYCTAAFVVLEFFSLLIRIFMAHRITNMNIHSYIKNVIYPTLIIIGASSICCLLPHYSIQNLGIRFFTTCIIYVIVYILLLWRFGIEPQTRNIIQDKILKKINNP